jgi:hypothetical protein
MSYTIAIRGIPNFAHLQYIQVERLEELFDSFTVRAKYSIAQGYVAEFYNKNGKRVMLYIAPRDASPEMLRQWCSAHYVKPSQSDANTHGASGHCHGWRLDAWHAIRPDAFPAYAQALQDAKDAEKARARAAQAQQEQEEATEEAMQEALESAIARSGYDAILQAINNA